MALPVLIAHHDPTLLKEFEQKFKDALYQVDIATNGKEAQKFIYEKDYFAILIDFQLKNHSSLQLLRYLQSLKGRPKARVLVFLNPQDIEQEDDDLLDRLQKLGTDEAILGPHIFEDIIETLEGHQSIGDLVQNLKRNKGQSPEEQVSVSDEDFTKISIDSFYSFKSVLFDVYIKLSENKFLKILHAGDDFSQERLNRYRDDKKVEFLYFKKSDRKKFIKFHVHLASKVVVNKKVNPTKKIDLLQSVTHKILEESFEEGIKPISFRQGQNVCENVYNMIENTPTLYKALRELEEFDPSIFNHSYLVTLFSGAIIKRFEWESKTMIENTALASMFHDIGKMNLPAEMLEMDPSEFNEEQRELYQNHPVMGVEILSNIKEVNQCTKQIVLQHHEYFDGTGFPHGLKGAKVFTLANIVCCADHLVKVMVKEEKKPVEALRMMLSNPEVVARFNSQVVEKLIEVFVDPEKIKSNKDFHLPSNSKVVPSR